jgi:hypothetical protein
MQALLLTWLASLANAGEATLRLAHAAGVQATLDGIPLMAVPLEPTLSEAHVPPGLHELVLHDANHRMIFETSVQLPDGFTVYCAAAESRVTCPRATRPGRVDDLPPSWGAGNSPTLALHTGGLAADVWLDGELALRAAGEHLALLSLRQGVHRLDLRDPGEEMGWAAGTFDTRSAEVISLHFDEDRQARFQPPARWRSGGGAGTPTLGPPRRTELTSVAISRVDLPRASLAPQLSDPWGDGTDASTPAAHAEVTLDVLDRDWYDVEVDGVLVAEFRGSKHRRLTLTPGRHTISVRPFMEEEVIVSGVLDTRDCPEIRFVIDGAFRSRSEPEQCFRTSAALGGP